MSHQALAVPGPREPRFAPALRRAAGRITWRVVATTLWIAVAFELWSFLEVTTNPKEEISLPLQYLSALVINVTMAFCLMSTTFVADELAANRARTWPLYASAIVVGAAAGAVLQWEIHRLLALPPRADIASDPGDAATAQRAFLFFEYLTWGGIIVWIYVSRRAQLSAEARMTAAQLQRAETQRRTLKARLHTLQLQVEPQFLQRTLARVRDRYESDPAEGSEMLGRLIVYLRAALPQLRESASTLAREVELARAYVDVMRGAGPGDIELLVDMPDELGGARMPPMIMLPLVGHALVHRDPMRPGTSTIGLSARQAGSVLRLVVSGDPRSFDPGDARGDLAAIRERLSALYGGEGGIAFERGACEGIRAIVEIPYETADGSSR